jgi:hypothetical protein
LRSKIQQLEEQDRELLKLQELNGDLGLEVQNLTKQLEKERTDRQKVETELSDRENEVQHLRRDLPGKAGKIYNHIKPLLAKKAPVNLLTKLEEILRERIEE